MPFDDDYKKLSDQPAQSGVKNVSSQKSIFDNKPRKQTQQEFDQRVKNVEEVKSGYKSQTAELGVSFNKLMADKTLVENKNILAQDMEREVLVRMVRLAEAINNDPAEEKDGNGSLSWVALLLKTCLNQRDRINQLEYELSKIKQATTPMALSVVINKEISAALDKKKVSE